MSSDERVLSMVIRVTSIGETHDVDAGAFNVDEKGYLWVGNNDSKEVVAVFSPHGWTSVEKVSE